MNTDDPIIAAIEAHRRAYAETCAAYERRNAVEDEQALKLLETQPTTIAGAAALLT
jgi:hypothetical protein